MVDAERGKSKRGVSRRKALLAMAWEVFSEQGYQSASMDMVVSRAGGSKQTLYNYFKSKEELLRAVLEARREELAERVYGSFEIPGDFVGSMWNFSIELLDIAINSDLIELYRLAIAESKTLMLGEWIYDLGFKGNWKVMAAYLERNVAPSKLMDGGGWTAAMHLRGLLEGDLVMRRLCDVMERIPRHDVALVVCSGLLAFFRIYVPDRVDELIRHADSELEKLKESEAPDSKANGNALTPPPME